VSWGSNSGDGVARQASDGSFTWLPAPNGNGLTGANLATSYTFKSIGTSNVAQVQVTVTPVNDAPVPGWYLPVGGWFVNEDSGSYLANAVQDGGPGGGTDELGQSLTGHASTDHPELFSSGPALVLHAVGQGLWSGSVTFTPAPDANGQGTISIWIMDSGGTANGGSDTTPKVVRFVTISPVNDAPTLTGFCGPFTIGRNAGPQGPTCFTASPGGGGNDERSQVLTGHVTVESSTDPGLFAVSPTLFVAPASDFGGNHVTNLAFTPATGHVGTATLLLWLSDDGGTANGGVDTGSKHRVSVTVGGPTPSAVRSTASPASPTSATASTALGQASAAASASAPPAEALTATPTSVSTDATSAGAPGFAVDGPPWIAVLTVLVILIVGTNLVLYQIVRARRTRRRP